MIGLLTGLAIAVIGNGVCMWLWWRHRNRERAEAFQRGKTIGRIEGMTAGLHEAVWRLKGKG